MTLTKVTMIVTLVFCIMAIGYLEKLDYIAGLA